MYRLGIIPDKWLLLTFVTIPKKLNSTQTFVKVIHRMYKKLEKDINNRQFVFQNELRRGILFTPNVML